MTCQKKKKKSWGFKNGNQKQMVVTSSIYSLSSESKNGKIKAIEFV